MLGVDLPVATRGGSGAHYTDAARAQDLRFSIIYLSLLFAALLVDHYLQISDDEETARRCRRRRLAAAAGRAATSCRPAAKPRSFKNTDVTGADYAQDFALTDHNGKPRTLADFKGKVVRRLLRLHAVPRRLPDDDGRAGRRDEGAGPAGRPGAGAVHHASIRSATRQELLAQYVPAFDPRFLGLRGDAAATAKVAKEFKVFYAKVPGKEPGSYTMDHTAGSYVFDQRRQGAPVHAPRAGRRADRARPQAAAELTRMDMRASGRTTPSSATVLLLTLGCLVRAAALPGRDPVRRRRRDLVLADVPAAAGAHARPPHARRADDDAVAHAAGDHPDRAGRLQPGRRRRAHLRPDQGHHRQRRRDAAGVAARVPLVGDWLDQYINGLVASREQMTELAKRMLEPARHFLTSGGMMLGGGVVADEPCRFRQLLPVPRRRGS